MKSRPISSKIVFFFFFFLSDATCDISETQVKWMHSIKPMKKFKKKKYFENNYLYWTSRYMH